MQVGKKKIMNHSTRVKRLSKSRKKAIHSSKGKRYIRMNRKTQTLGISSETYIPKVRLSPVFSTKEQEEMFARCAEESMSIQVGLKW